MSKLCIRQAEEMEEAVKNLGGAFTDEQINLLAQRHFENTQVNVDICVRIHFDNHVMATKVGLP